MQAVSNKEDDRPSIVPPELIAGNTLDELIGEAEHTKTSLAEQIQVHMSDLWLYLDVATKIALAAPTRRGALLRMLIGDFPHR